MGIRSASIRDRFRSGQASFFRLLFASSEALRIMRGQEDHAGIIVLAAEQSTWIGIAIGNWVLRRQAPCGSSDCMAQLVVHGVLQVLCRSGFVFGYAFFRPNRANQCDLQRARISSDSAALPAESKKQNDTAHKDAAALFHTHLERLRNCRALDAACGSGNFLCLALKALKDMERRANTEAEALGLQRPKVGAGDTAKCAATGAKWPACDAIVGNPSFAGTHCRERRNPGGVG